MDQLVKRERPPVRARSPEDGQVDPRIGDEITRMLSSLRGPSERQELVHGRDTEASQGAGGSLAFGLAERVGKALHLSGERARALESRMEGVIQRASEELENAHKRIEALEAKLKVSEGREQKLEARVRDADQWMQKIHDALSAQMVANPDLFAALGESSDERTGPTKD